MGSRRKGLAEASPPPAPFPCTSLWLPSRSRKGMLPRRVSKSRHIFLLFNIPGVWGQSPQLLLERARGARSAFSPFAFWIADRRAGAVRAAHLFRRRESSRAGDRSIAFCRADFARRRSRVGAVWTSGSEIANYNIIPRQHLTEAIRKKWGREGALMRCQEQQLRGLPSGIQEPPRPRLKWRSTTCQ